MKRMLKLFQSNKKSSASIAKERLQIIISHERTKKDRAHLLASMQQELIEVIAKHLQLEPGSVKDQIKLDLAQNEGQSVLELNITLPDEELVAAAVES